MELLLPQIAWHAKEPIQSVDASSAAGLIATAGNDNEVRLWKLPTIAGRGEGISFVQSLSGHSKVRSRDPALPSPRRRRADVPERPVAQPVNVVRFSPDGSTLASAGDDTIIMLWRERKARPGGTFGEPSRPAGTPTPETEWAVVCALRGHSADIYGLAWSPRGDSLFTGGVDGTTIVWNLSKAKPAQQLRE